MSRPFTVKPAQTAVKAYYEALAKYAGQGVDHEGAVRTAFQNLLDQTGRRFGWPLVPELSTKTNGQSIRPDGTFLDDFHMRRGFWEAKDTHDDLVVRMWPKRLLAGALGMQSAYDLLTRRQGGFSILRSLPSLHWRRAGIAGAEPAHDNCVDGWDSIH